MHALRPVRTTLPLLLIGAMSCLQAQTSPASSQSIEALHGGFVEVAGWITEAGKRVPAAQYDYRPAESVRTLGQLIGHIADGNAFFCGKAAGGNPEWAETVALSGAGKDELLQKLEASIAACTKAYHTSNAARVRELVANLGHASLHYGNLVTYLRMLGITPPSS